MEKLPRIASFEKLGFGMFIHFGLYSLLGKGEWAKFCLEIPDKEYYGPLMAEFDPSPNAFDRLAEKAKESGMRYLVLTTRHHDGFSLYDTHGLSELDAMHAKCHRDLVKEFVEACRNHGMVPFFYHTVIDWHHPNASRGRYSKEYWDYEAKSIELLCRNYGEIGGFWFDGTWGLPEGVSFPNSIYQMIHKLQPNAIITNNTGLSALGEKGVGEIDCCTFERGQVFSLEQKGKYVAAEKCNVMDDHWGYAADDVNYKGAGELIQDILRTRHFNANYLLNVGPMGGGSLSPIQAATLDVIGHWFMKNGESFASRKSPIEAKEADRVYVNDGDDCSYVFVEGLPMVADSHVSIGTQGTLSVHLSSVSRTIRSLRILDNGQTLPFHQEGNQAAFDVPPFSYGSSWVVRVVRICY